MRRVLTLIMIAAFLLSAAPAFAAAPVASGKTDVQLWPGAQAGQPIVVIASIVVTETVSLPVTVQFPVPEGMTVDWAGEIVGGDAAQDVQRQPQLKTGKGGQYAEFEISTSRQAQIELSGGTVQAQGANLVAAFDWVQSVGAGLVSFSVRMPAGAQVGSIDPAPAGAPQRNTTGETLYTLTNVDLKTGDKQAISVSYTMNAAANAGAGNSQGGSGNSTTIVAVLVGALVIAGAALVIALRRQAPAAPEAPPSRAARSGTSRSEARPRPERTPEPPADSADDDDEAFRFDD